LINAAAILIRVATGRAVAQGALLRDAAAIEKGLRRRTSALAP
jgi:hypothetical protein